MDLSSIDRWRETILFLIALILSIAVHEFGHAWAANRLGDPLPKAQGRLTLNPIRHIDPIGTLLFPMLMSFGVPVMLGWGRPVQTNPSNYTKRLSRATGSLLVSLAGPAMNLLLALLVSVIIVVGMRLGAVSGEVGEMLVQRLVLLNISLMLFNLIPIPPLDGGAVLAWVLPRSLQGVTEFLSRWGYLILIGVMMTRFSAFLTVPGEIVSRAWVGVLARIVGS